MDIRNLDLRHLRYFLAVAEELNFTRAAERLNMAQPPLSRQIQELESIIGAPLFLRSRRRVQLTSAGTVLRKEIMPWIAELPQRLNSASKTALGQGGVFRLGTNSATISLPFVPMLLRRWRTAHPKVHLTFSDLLSIDQQEALENGQIDAGLMWNTSYRLPNLRYDRIAQVPLVAFLECNHPLARRAAISVEALAAYNIITFPRSIGTTIFQQIMELFASHDVAPLALYEYIDFTMIQAAIAASEGIGILPANFPNLRPKKLVMRSISGAKNYAVDLWLITPKTTILPTTLTMRKLIME